MTRRFTYTLSYLFSFILIASLSVFITLAFDGPTENPPTESGAISVENGNVGIGTTSPDSLLHIKGSEQILNVVETTGTSLRSRIVIPEALNNFAKFEIATLPTGGSSTNMLAEITSNIKQVSPDTLKSNLSFATNRGDDLVVGMTLNEEGNIGIGTPNPGQKLAVSGGNIQLDSGNRVGFNTQSWGMGHNSYSDTGTRMLTNATTQIGVYGLDDTQGFQIIDYNNNDVAFEVSGTGNVYIPGKTGIGTTIPQAPLDVFGNIRFLSGQSGGPLLWSASSNIATLTAGGSIIFNLDNSGNGNQNFQVKTNSGTPLIYALDSGGIALVGIGTTSPNSNAKLTVNGNTFLTGTDPRLYLYEPDLNYFIGRTGTTVQVQSSGNVSIDANSGNLSLNATNGTLTLNGATISASGKRIQLVADPQSSDDVATKGYVDSAAPGGSCTSVWSATVTESTSQQLLASSS